MDTFRAFYGGDIYHICNKSISNYQIFRSDTLSSHFQTTINYYNNYTEKICLSKALKKHLELPPILTRLSNHIFHILAFCIMPDHYHLLIKVQNELIISKYINDIQNSYTRYYNKMNNRRGPLWQNRFRSIYIKNDETLLHVLRYIHLNPTTAGFVDSPEKWKWSSYSDYVSDPKILTMNKEISIQSIDLFKQFTEDQIDYQKTIKGIRRKLLE